MDILWIFFPFLYVALLYGCLLILRGPFPYRKLEGEILYPDRTPTPFEFSVVLSGSQRFESIRIPIGNPYFATGYRWDFQSKCNPLEFGLTLASTDEEIFPQRGPCKTGRHDFPVPIQLRQYETVYVSVKNIDTMPDDFSMKFSLYGYRMKCERWQ